MRIVEANSAALAFWGEDNAASLFQRLFFPGDAAASAFAGALERARQAGGAVDGVLTLRPRGEAVTMEARFAATDRPAGLLDVTLGAPTSVSAPGEDAARLGFEAAPQPLAVFSRDGAALERNEADRRLFPDALGFADRFDDAAVGARALAAAVAEGGFSCVAYAADGARLRINARRACDANGHVRIVLQCDLLPGEGEAGGGVDAETLAQIAHDLRAPIAAAQSAADFLSMATGLTASERSDYLRDVSATCDQLIDRIERLVAFGASARAAEGGDLGLVDLVEAAETTWRLQMRRAAEAGASLVFEKPAHPVMTLGDRHTVATVLAALIDNALAHGRPTDGAPAKIKVSVRADEPAVIEVSDNGPGLSENQLVRLSVGDASLDGAPGGFGLSGAVADAGAMAARIELDRAEAGGLLARLVFSAH